MKPGWQTTEFFIALVSQGLGVLMIMGIVSSADRATLEGALASAVGAIATLIGSAAVVREYIRARTAQKTTHAYLAQPEATAALATAAPRPADPPGRNGTPRA